MLKVHLKHVDELLSLESLRELLDPQIVLSFGEITAGSEFDILVDGFADEQALTASPSLRAVIVPWAGAPIETVEQFRRFPRLTLHNLPYNAAPTAETALALLLGVAKRIALHDRTFRHHLWSLPSSAGPGSVILEDRVALVLGYGRVGQRVARGCRGLGMQVRAICRSPDSGRGDQIFGPESLHELLPTAAALMICLPHTPITDHLIGTSELALLPEHAVVVNVARGPIVDEQALYRALSARRIFGAGLDVWYRYPGSTEREKRIPFPPAHAPFHELDNVVMSPHRAGWSEETEIRRCAMLADSLNAAAGGGAIPFRIDPGRGY